MPGLTVYYPTHDSFMPDASDIMTATSRDAAKRASVEITWVFQRLLASEVDTVRSQEGQTERMKKQKNGSGIYLLHAIFFCPQPTQPIEECGMPGDLWVSEPHIFWRSMTNWQRCRPKATDLATHPFLTTRHLSMHATHCSLQWLAPANIRQHWSKRSWGQQVLEDVQYPGGHKEVVSKDHMKAIIAMSHTALSEAHVSQYMSSILPLFLPGQSSSSTPKKEEVVPYTSERSSHDDSVALSALDMVAPSGVSPPAFPVEPAPSGSACAIPSGETGDTSSSDGTVVIPPLQTDVAVSSGNPFHVPSIPADTVASLDRVSAVPSTETGAGVPPITNSPTAVSSLLAGGNGLLSTVPKELEEPIIGAGSSNSPLGAVQVGTVINDAGSGMDQRLPASDVSLDAQSGTTCADITEHDRGTQGHSCDPLGQGDKNQCRDGRQGDPAVVLPAYQPYYDLFPRSKYAADRDNLHNFRFWNGAVIGAAPEINIPGIKKEILLADRKLLEWMSKGQDATAPGERNGKTVPPLVVVMTWPSEGTYDEKIQVAEKIKSVICNNRVVALLMSDGNGKLNWTEKEIGQLMTGIPGNCTLFGNWQSTMARTHQFQTHRWRSRNMPIDIYQAGTVAEFLDCVAKEDDPVNWLDSPRPGGHADEVIGMISNDCAAFGVTSRWGFQKLRPAASEAAKSAPTVSNKGGRASDTSCTASGKVNEKVKGNSLKRTREDRDDDAEKEGVTGREKKRPRGIRVTAGSARRSTTTAEQSCHPPSAAVGRGSPSQIRGGSSKTATGRDGPASMQDGTSSAVPLKNHGDHKFVFEYTGIRSHGGKTMEQDIDFKRRWIILTGRFFLTWAHHDTAGFITWIRMLTGLKIWSCLVPKNLSDDAETASAQYLELVNALNHYGDFTENLLPNLADVHNFFLFPGTILIQPPGMVHQVLTVDRSATRGGYFYMWDGMHLTEWARILSHQCRRVGTNDLHEGILRTAARMMLALSTMGPIKVPKKPFMAHARQLIHAEEYWRGDFERKESESAPQGVKGVSKNAPHYLKESRNEIDEGIRIAKAIMAHHGLSTGKIPVRYKVVQGQKEMEPVSWTIPDGKGGSMTDNAWYEVGEEYIEIPKFRYPEED